MPLVDINSDPIDTLATLGVIAHIRGEIDATTYQLESYLYEHYEEFSSASTASYAMDNNISAACVRARIQISLAIEQLYGADAAVRYAINSINTAPDLQL